MKTISFFLALINSLLAGLLVTFLVTSVDFRFSVAWWSAARITLALTVIAVGVLTWINSIAPMRPDPLVLGSLFLVALGPATVVWAFHRASQTGTMEYYMLLYGASLFVQGVALLFEVLQEPEKASLA